MELIAAAEVDIESTGEKRFMFEVDRTALLPFSSTW